MQRTNPGIFRYAFGATAARLPYAAKTGPSYWAFRRQVDRWSTLDSDQQERFLLERLNRVIAVANALPPYRDLYRDAGYDGSPLNSLADLQLLPTVTKDQLAAHEPEERAARRPTKVNYTSGTTAQPFGFAVERRTRAREYAYIHHLWSHVGYSPHAARLTIRSADLGADPIRYRARSHEFLVNVHLPMSTTIRPLDDLYRTASAPRWIFAMPGGAHLLCEELLKPDGTRLLRAMRQRLKGVLLASEHAPSGMRKMIEHTLEAPTHLYYGQREQVVIAPETQPHSGIYTPIECYGLAEAEDTRYGEYQLVGTNLHNEVAPLIRYEMNDLIHPEFGEHRRLSSFRMVWGRATEFLLDTQGCRHSVTGTRNTANITYRDTLSLQVGQAAPGQVYAFYVPRLGTSGHRERLRQAYAASPADITYTVIEVDRPFITQSGKRPLKIPDENVRGMLERETADSRTARAEADRGAPAID